MDFLFAPVPWAGILIERIFVDKGADIPQLFVANFADIGFLGSRQPLSAWSSPAGRYWRYSRTSSRALGRTWA